MTAYCTDTPSAKPIPQLDTWEATYHVAPTVQVISNHCWLSTLQCTEYTELMGHNNLPLLSSWTTVVSWSTESDLKTKSKQTNQKNKTTQPQDMLLNLYNFTFNQAFINLYLIHFNFVMYNERKGWKYNIPWEEILILILNILVLIGLI